MSENLSRHDMPRYERPRVSVCVPVYNGEAFLGEALDSILAQTFEDYELIIADNASIDATSEICKKYAAKDPRIRYYRNDTNIGANPNFNRLVGLARGVYFKLANADDSCAPTLLARCVAVLDHHPEAVLCYARTRLIDAGGRTLGDYEDGLDLSSQDAIGRFQSAIRRIRLVNVLQGVIRTDVLRQTSLLRSFEAADVLLVLELVLRGQFHEVPERLFYRRMHAGASSSLSNADEMQRFVDPGVPTEYSCRICRMHLGYLVAFVRTPLSLRDRMLLAGWAVRSLVQQRESVRKEIVNVLRSILWRPISRARLT